MSGFGKIVIATDKFKGSMTAVQASEAIRDGIIEGYCSSGETMPQILLRPMADGGEGSMGVMERALLEASVQYEKAFMDSVNHLGEPILAPVLLYNGTDGTREAFVEMASVCGLNMVPREKRNLLRSTTYGLGTVIRTLIEEHGIRRMLLAIGGSGTNDGGFKSSWPQTSPAPCSDRSAPQPYTGRRKAAGSRTPRHSNRHWKIG